MSVEITFEGDNNEMWHYKDGAWNKQETQTNNGFRHAWECPRCHRVNAPWIDNCECEPVDTAKLVEQAPYWPNYPYTWPWTQPQYPQHPITWTTTTGTLPNDGKSSTRMEP